MALWVLHAVKGVMGLRRSTHGGLCRNGHVPSRAAGEPRAPHAAVPQASLLWTWMCISLGGTEPVTVFNLCRTVRQPRPLTYMWYRAFYVEGIRDGTVCFSAGLAR